jgi:hypothetical protein
MAEIDKKMQALEFSSAPVEQRDLYATMEILREHHRENAAWLAATFVTVTLLQLLVLFVFALAFWDGAMAKIINMVGANV